MKRIINIHDGLLKKSLDNARHAKDIQTIAQRCVDHPEDFDFLIEAMTHKDTQTSSRAAWAMSHAVQISPAILEKKQHIRLIEIADKAISGSLKRNIMRAWQSVELPSGFIYEIADLALRFLGNPKEDVAVKAFSITVLQNCLKQIPELKEEVLFLIEKEMPHATAAFVVRAGKFQKFVSRLDAGK